MEISEAAGPTDEQLLLDLRNGNTDGLALLVSRWEQPLFRFVYRILERREDARDVCQETFVRVLRNAPHFREGARFSTWMYQIALNLCRDHLRKKRRWSLILGDGHEAEEAASEPPDRVSPRPAAEAESRERRRAVQRALLALPAEQREVIVLKEYEGLKFREIADILKCPESTVKSRMYQALDTMRLELTRQGID